MSPAWTFRDNPLFTIIMGIHNWGYRWLQSDALWECTYVQSAKTYMIQFSQRTMVLCPFSDKTPTLELNKRKPQTVIRTIECLSLKWPGVNLDRALMCSITCFESFSCYLSIWYFFSFHSSIKDQEPGNTQLRPKHQ